MPKPKVYIGIDPGATGAIVVLDPDGRVVRREVMGDAHTFCLLMQDIQETCTIQLLGLEKAQAMGIEGRTSLFNYAAAWGRLDGILTALGIRYVMISPQTWTKKMHAGTTKAKPKVRSFEAVKRLAPELDLLATPRCSKPHMGIVDAYLIAEFVRLTY